jgi:hypothetical protein
MFLGFRLFRNRHSSLLLVKTRKETITRAAFDLLIGFSFRLTAMHITMFQRLWTYRMGNSWGESGDLNPAYQNHNLMCVPNTLYPQTHI